MMSRSSLSPFNIINTWNKLTRYQHHHRFLLRCQQLNSIPKGLKLKFNLALGTSNYQLRARCEFLLQQASKKILHELVEYTLRSSAELQRELHTKRRNLFDQFDHEDATVCWVRAKSTVNLLNRNLNLRYRNKVKNLIPLLRKAPSDVRPKIKTTRRFSKQVRKTQKERFFKTLERRRQELEANSLQFHPINLSLRDLSDDQKSLLSKGPSFCPVPRDINRIKLLEDWEKFENRLRAAVFFHRDDVNNNPSTTPHQPVFPTVKKVSSWKAPMFLSLNSFWILLERNCSTLGMSVLFRTIFPLVRDKLWLHLSRLIMSPFKFKTKGPNLWLLTRVIMTPK